MTTAGPRRSSTGATCWLYTDGQQCYSNLVLVWGACAVAIRARRSQAVSQWRGDDAELLRRLPQRRQHASGHQVRRPGAGLWFEADPVSDLSVGAVHLGILELRRAADLVWRVGVGA